MSRRLVVLTDEEIKAMGSMVLSDERSCIAHGEKQPDYLKTILAKLRAALEQPEGISEEWRSIDETEGTVLADPTDLDDELRAYLLRSLIEPERRYCTPWTALHREDGEG